MRDLLIDLRHGFRLLTRAPGFSTLAVSILAIGIGAATLVFSLVHAVLLRALPFEDPDRVVWMYNLRTERDRAPLSIPDIEDYRRQASTLSGLTVFTNWTANLTGDGSPERLEGTRVAGNFFELLGLRPLLGRPIQPGDEERDARVAVLTHGLWLRRFGGDPGTVGRTVLLNGSTYTVVGVLPRGFMFPFRDAEIAVPLILRSDPRRADRGANFLRALARLAPGATLQQAKEDLDAIAHRLQVSYPTENARKTGISLYPLHVEIVRDYRTVLWTLFAAVGVLLGTGCGNLANLLLVRTAGRQTELAVRLALGASRGRLARQLLSEATALAVSGGAVGVGFAAIGLTAWRTWGPAGFPRMADADLNLDVVIFALGIAGLTALTCGALPACFLSRDVSSALRGATRTMTKGREFSGLRRIFVGAQVAASAVLLVGVVLTAQGLRRLERVAPGFTPDQSLSVQLSLPPRTYSDRDALVRFSAALEDRFSAMPGVQTTGLVSLLPLSGLLSTMDIAFPDRPPAPPDEVPQAHFRIASPGYFAAAGIPVLAGRPFTDHDRTPGHLVAIVSQTFASRYWPGTSAIGQSVQLVQSNTSPPLEVVGVVSDVKHFTLDSPSTADLYVPLRQMPSSQTSLLASRMFWVVRAHGEARALESAIREAVSQIDPGVAASSGRTLEAVVSRSLAAARLNARLLELFGEAGTAVCVMGVYAIAAFSTRTRRRELAIRAALGARHRDLTRLMLLTELRPVVTGVGLGLVIAWLASRRLFGTPFGTSPHDGTTYLAVGIGLVVTGAIACYAPVWRAGAANPAETLNT